MTNQNPLTKYHYNETTRKAVAVFGNLFNRLYISRNDGKGHYKHERVPLSYSPREKFIARIREQSKIQDKRIAIRLPRMAFELTSFDYDSDTQLNKKNKMINRNDENADVVWQSVPYNLTFELTLYSRGLDENYQLLEQILPIFTPNYFVTVEDIETPNKLTDVPIELTGVSKNDTYDGAFNDRRVITKTLTFSMKVKYSGWVRNNPIILISEVNTFLRLLDNDELRPDIETIARVEEDNSISVNVNENI